jgi:template-activating factor I
MTKQDIMILKHLTSFEVEDPHIEYSITFNFSSNPYFENESIRKSYKIRHGKSTSESTAINWERRQGNLNKLVLERKEMRRDECWCS